MDLVVARDALAVAVEYQRGRRDPPVAAGAQRQRAADDPQAQPPRGRREELLRRA